MGLLQSYSLFLLKHPGKILLSGTSFVLLLLGLTFLIRQPPSFKDPLLGFEARDTPLAARINTWKLLLDETSASASNLSLAANSPTYEGAYQSVNNRNQNEIGSSDTAHNLPEPPIVEESTQDIKNNSSSASDLMDEDEDEYYKSINSTLDTMQPNLMHYSLGSSKAFCGKIYEGHAQVVISASTRYSSSGLFNLNSMLAICQLDRKLRLEQTQDESIFFQRDCERFQLDEGTEHKSATTCCNSWSLPNYMACLNNKTNCFDIDLHDLKNTEHLLILCAPYYFRAPYEECFNGAYKDKSVPVSSASSLSILSSTTSALHGWSRSHCGNIPEKCMRCDGWTFAVLNYLTNDNFIHNRAANESNNRVHSNKHEKQRPSRESSINKLTYTNIFLPIAKSSSLMKYYQALSRYSLKTPYAQVKAMNLGLKNSLFERLISDDLKLFVIALISILIVISIYVWSVILSLVILMIITLSLSLSYSIYQLVFNIPIFPFMNLLAVVISFGICSDNAMLFCKNWMSRGMVDELEQSGNNNQNKSLGKEQINLDRMLKRAIVSTFVATLATACSFIISAISKVIAVRCFCIFATLSVITNYLLIIVLLPPALIFDSRFSAVVHKFIEKGSKLKKSINFIQNIRKNMLELGTNLHRIWIFNVVTKCKFYLIITFISLLACSSILVFHRPTLKPTDEEGVQLLSSEHTFEQYDKNLKKQFAFERYKMGDTIANNKFNDVPETLPILIVFGVEPIFNGHLLDPHDRGTITFDPKFDMADSNVQIWLLEFCQKLKQQRFIHPSSAPDLSSCFIDTFKSWLETRSCKDPIQPDIDRSPCCQTSEFPYSRYTFNKCIGEAVNIMRKTPQFHPNINGGIRFFKNSTRVAALIIEYQSNRLFSESFSKMDRFYSDIDDWVTWQINNTAPQSLKSGWFISSNLELLALQTELDQSTSSSILLEVLFATMALMLGTRDLVLTIAGTLTVGTIIIVTVAVLILLKWTLGVAESILVSLTIGLSIDFALHYTVAYSDSRNAGTSHAVLLGILDEVAGPIALATVTTSLAGFVIVWSDILAYQELGVFLMLIALASWTISTFFLLPMLATISIIAERGELYVRSVYRQILKILLDRL